MRKSTIPKHKKLKTVRAEKRAAQEHLELLAGLKAGTIIPVDRAKVFSRSVLPKVPGYYRDTWFTCKDCGERDLWTAKQQQRWYEEQGGEIEAVAIRCRSCRRKEKSRREIARRVHLGGLVRKRARQAEPDAPMAARRPRRTIRTPRRAAIGELIRSAQAQSCRTNLDLCKRK